MRVLAGVLFDQDMTADADAVATRAVGLRNVAAAILAVVSGATDAIGFLALGGAFTSVMTGNMVLFGLGVARSDGELVGHAAVAIACFVAGCVLGTTLAAGRSADGVWPRSVTRAFAVETAVVLCYAVCWWTTGSHPGSGLQLGLLGINAVALGVQSSAIQRFGVAGLSTTYMTGTLTTLFVKLASGRSPREVSLHGTLLLGLVSGAIGGGLLATHLPVAAPILPLAGLVTVTAIGLRASGYDARMSEPNDRSLPPEPHDGIDAARNADARAYEQNQSSPLARASDGPPPTTGPAPGEVPDPEGTGAGDPLAGVHISAEDDQAAVPGDEGPEHPGVRRSS